VDKNRKAGVCLENNIHNILSQGSILEAGKQRHYLFKHGLGLRINHEAEYTIISGCAVPFGIIEPFIALLHQITKIV
jgi:hypothetical protein